MNESFPYVLALHAEHTCEMLRWGLQIFCNKSLLAVMKYATISQKSIWGSHFVEWNLFNFNVQFDGILPNGKPFDKENYLDLQRNYQQVLYVLHLFFIPNRTMNFSSWKETPFTFKIFYLGSQWTMAGEYLFYVFHNFMTLCCPLSGSQGRGSPNGASSGNGLSGIWFSPGGQWHHRDLVSRYR